MNAINDNETTANSVNDETNAEQSIDQSDVTKELIFSICENCMTKNFDKISYSYEYRSYYETGYHMEENNEVYVDNTQDTAIRKVNGGYYRGDGSGMTMRLLRIFTPVSVHSAMMSTTRDLSKQARAYILLKTRCMALLAPRERSGMKKLMKQ